MARSKADIFSVYSPAGDYILFHEFGWRKHHVAVVQLVSHLIGVAGAVAAVRALPGLSEATYAVVFSIVTLCLAHAVRRALLAGHWRRQRRTNVRAKQEARKTLQRLAGVAELNAAQEAEFAIATCTMHCRLAKSCVSPAAMRYDIPAMDARLAERGLRRPKMYLGDVRTVLLEPGVERFHEAEKIRLPAGRPLLLLPWFALSAAAWYAWVVTMSEAALGVAIGSLLLAALDQAQSFPGQSVWRPSDWRTAPGRLGRCEINSSVEAAADTHIMIVGRTIDGAMQLMFVGDKGMEFAVYAGRRTGKRYKQIWREWLYDGAPAPPLVETI